MTMQETEETGQDVTLTGKSGRQYNGKIYSKENTNTVAGRSIVCLTNSSRLEDGWNHKVNSIYNSESGTEALAHFRERDDISHLVLLPYADNQGGNIDSVDDLIRNYIHG